MHTYILGKSDISNELNKETKQKRGHRQFSANCVWWLSGRMHINERLKTKSRGFNEESKKAKTKQEKTKKNNRNARDRQYYGIIISRQKTLGG